MTKEQDQSPAPSDDNIQQMVAESDVGGRQPTGFAEKVLLGGALLWSLFQIWIASPLPFLDWPIVGSFGVFNDTEARSIHLAFAVFLAYLGYPALKRSPRSYIPIQDWIFAIVAAFCAGYLFLFYHQLSQRPAAPITADLWVGCIGMVLLLEATRRALGPPLLSCR